MNKLSRIAATALLAIAAVSSVDNANATDPRIVKSLRANNFASDINIIRRPRLDTECQRARFARKVEWYLSRRCDARQPGTYYSLTSCRCEVFN